MKKRIVAALSLSLVMSVVFSSGLVFAQDSAASAESAIVTETELVEKVEIEDINSARNGVVQVNYVYEDENDKTHIVKGGAGFIIGDSEKSEYVLTCVSNISLDAETKIAAFDYYGIPKDKSGEYKDIDLRTQVVAANDVTVEAAIVATSEELDLAVLRLSQPIHTRTPLSIYTSESGTMGDIPYAIADKVYALGFPGEIIFADNEKCYSYDRVAMTTGSIANITTLNDVPVIQHDAVVAKNNCGGPLVNEEGKVIGMNIIQKDGDYYCALDSTAIIKVLDALGIEYEKSIYEEDIPISSNEASSDEDDDGTRPDKIPLVLLIVIGVLALILVAIVAVLIILLNKNKTNNDNADKKKDFKIQEPQPFSVGKMAVEKSVYTSNSDNGTSVLGGTYENGTSVLGGNVSNAGTVFSGTLIRKKNGRQTFIDKPVFTIGKDSLHANLCISDNGAISRTHAIIRVKDNGVYLEDCNSTNGTYVDNRRIVAGQSVKLLDGSVIKLADEEFEYRI
jgi:S1-C subfamily serine protease